MGRCILDNKDMFEAEGLEIGTLFMGFFDDAR